MTTTINLKYQLPNNDIIKFESHLHNACLLLDFLGLQQTFKEFQLLSHPDFKDFIEQASEVFNRYTDLGVKVIGVTSFDTNCIACVFGKKVKAYNITYVKDENGVKIQYSGAFAINLKIENNQLLEFSFCNAFLSKNEIEKI